jgi:hypothetical protein
MPNTILLKRSGIANAVPVGNVLQQGELALNYTDGNLFFKNNSGNVELLTSNKFISVVGNISGNNISANNVVEIGTTQVTWATTTTTSNVQDQTIATVNVGTYNTSSIEFLIKSVDSTGNRRSSATVMAVTDGESVNYTTFGVVNLGGSTGTLAVNIANSGNVVLQATPYSSNSTVWTTQYRLI